MVNSNVSANSPTIPNITPVIDLKNRDIINLLLASIALEEISLAQILSAEASKIEELLAARGPANIDDMIRLDREVSKILDDVIKQQMLLDFKFQNILDLIEARRDNRDC
ncbi:hypothetical protein ABG79_00500 [Caloramator mitchellensis]|uniref:Uncharacterized protein n=1 Tax=Caloramator mitchellensis TaxID=908809 RepID=A0A0R3K429_CALMK|nr:hypothetical protein [Caloramator mitchellensis]KRQ87698.1 hypothetical protein ABG79_00500 [Caloramator mitchellensis]